MLRSRVYIDKVKSLIVNRAESRWCDRMSQADNDTLEQLQCMTDAQLLGGCSSDQKSWNWLQNNAHSFGLGLTIPPATIVRDKLWLGCSFNAADYNFLKTIRAEVVFNCTSDLSNYHEGSFEYERFPLLDNKESNMESVFDNIVSAYKRHKGKTIFVHCYAGASRSAAIVLALLVIDKYLCPNEEQDIEHLQSEIPAFLDDQYARLRKRRPCVDLNINYYTFLKSNLVKEICKICQQSGHFNHDTLKKKKDEDLSVTLFLNVFLLLTSLFNRSALLC